MRIRGIMLIAIAAMAMLPSAAQADPPAKVYLDMLDKGGEQKRIVGLLLGTYFDAFLWSNVYIGQMKGPRMYCQPESMVLQTDQGIDILQRYVKAHPQEADLPTGLAIMKAFADTFPCGDGVAK